MIIKCLYIKRYCQVLTGKTCNGTGSIIYFSTSKQKAGTHTIHSDI